MTDFLSRAEDPVLERFARRFLAKTVQNGFGSMSKRDAELLLFYELELSGLVPTQASHHEVAKLLRVTPRRVAALRRDAWARWARENEIREHLRGTLQALFEPDAIRTVLEENRKVWQVDGLLPVALEHPSDRAEVEQFLKRRHSVVHTARNREVLLLTHTAALDLAQSVVGEISEKQKQAIRSAFGKDATLKTFLTKDIRKSSWREARVVLGNTLGQVLEKATVDGAAKALAVVFGALLA